MIYRTYKAPTYKEAVVNAKMDLGSDVYIIGRKEVREGGFLGLFSKVFTEITVAKNEDNSNQKVENVKRFKDPQSFKTSGDGGTGSWVARPSGSLLPEGTIYSGNGLKQDGTVLSDLHEIKLRLREVLDSRNAGEGAGNSPFLNRLIALLKENDFSDNYIRRVREKFETELSIKDVQMPEVLEEKIKAHILESIETAGPIEIGNGKASVVVLVGPTGVGKTTTIAKLAASFGVLQKRKVELFTIDSYRIAAIEQLGKYAELMQLPFTVINSREEFKNAVMNSKAEMIFVDTVGRSQKDNMKLAELRNILDGVKTEMDIHLVLSATTKYRDAIDIVTRFNQLMYSKIIITKLDETNTIGSILSVLHKGKKLSYFTTGQSVPDDIEIAQKEKLFDMLSFDKLNSRAKV